MAAERVDVVERLPDITHIGTYRSQISLYVRAIQWPHEGGRCYSVPQSLHIGPRVRE